MSKVKGRRRNGEMSECANADLYWIQDYDSGCLVRIKMRIICFAYSKRWSWPQRSVALH